MEDAIAQRGCGDALRQHFGDENRPWNSEQHDIALVPEVVNSFAELGEIARPCIPGNVRWNFARLNGHLTLAHSEVADQRYGVCRRVQREHTAKMDALVYKSNDRSRNHPSALNAG